MTDQVAYDRHFTANQWSEENNNRDRLNLFIWSKPENVLEVEGFCRVFALTDGINLIKEVYDIHFPFPRHAFYREGEFLCVIK